MQTRRKVLGSTVLGAAALGSSFMGAPALGGRPAFAKDGHQTMQNDLKAPLANFERARALMADRGIDALIVRQRVNVRYFTGYIPFLTHLGFETPGLAVIPRDPARGVTLVASIADLWRLSQQDGWVPDMVIPYSGAYDPQALTQMTAPKPYPADMGWPVSRETLTDNDQAMLDYVERYAPNVAASPAWGLIKALETMGLKSSVIAYDDPAVPAMLGEHGVETLTCQDGINLIRRIRMVKTPGELALMRQVGERNSAATHHVMQALEPGMTRQDIERAFAVETAKRDLNAVFIVAGSLHHLPHGEMREGTPILIDAVSEYQGYHGDYGRTFLLGEAPRAFKPKTQKLQIAWQAAFDMIKPGVRYSQIRAAAIEAVRKAAIGEHLVAVNPHSVGLQHTDEPGMDGVPGFVKDDIVLEEGMTMTVDLPHIEPGWGAAHLEDLIVVTRNGAEPLNDMSNPVVEL